MSDSKHPRVESVAAVAAADGTNTQAARTPLSPRHADAAAAAMAAVVLPSLPSHSPVTMLYPHALESIFAFASVKELAALMAVSRSWQSGVMSMRPLALRIVYPRALRGLFASRLRRHVAHIGEVDWRALIGVDSLLALAERMPHLRSLHVELDFLPSAPLKFPRQLSQFSMECGGASAMAGFIGRAMVSLAQQAPLLEQMGIRYRSRNHIDLTPLASMSQLRQLDLSELRISQQQQVQPLRNMSQLEVLCLRQSWLLPELWLLDTPCASQRFECPGTWWTRRRSATRW